MKIENPKIQKGLRLLKRNKKLKERSLKERSGEIPLIAYAVFVIGCMNGLMFILPKSLPDPLWALFIPMITFPLNILLSFYAWSEIKFRNSDGGELVITGLAVNAFFLLMPFSFFLNPPSF